MRVKVKIWTIYVPDETNTIIGHRWVLKCQNFIMISNTTFTSRKNCSRSMRKIIEKYNFKIIELKVDYRTNEELLV